MASDAPAQATTPRPAEALSSLRRFSARYCYRSDDPKLFTYASGFVERAEPPSAAEMQELLMDEALRIMRGYGHTVAGPLRVDGGGKMFELPTAPVPAATDRRPLRHWKIRAIASCEELRFEDPIERVFGWPDAPPREVVAAMERVLAHDAVAARGHDLSYVEVTEALGVTVLPTTEPMNFAAR